MPFGQTPEYASLVYISLSSAPITANDVCNKEYVDNLTNPPGSDGSVIIADNGQLSTADGFVYDTNSDTLYVDNVEIADQLTLDVVTDVTVPTGFTITNLGTPLLNSDAANKAYLDTKYALTDGDLDMGGNAIINLANDASSTSAVTKSYVDANLTKVNYSAVVTPIPGVGYNTIGAAILAGATSIFVRAGTYTEAGPITLPPGVTIIGEDMEQCIVNFTGAGFSLPGSSVTGHGTTGPGLITMTNGSATVTQTSSNWSGFSNTLYLTVGNAVLLNGFGLETYKITSFNSGNNLTLQSTYRGVSFSGISYSLRVYSGVTLKNLTIQTSTPSNDVISLNSVIFGTIENVTTVGRVTITYGVDMVIKDCVFQGSESTAGCILNYFSKGIVENVTVTGSTSTGMILASASNTRFERCTFSDNGGIGIEATFVSGFGDLYVTFSDCSFLRNVSHGALLTYIRDSFFINCVFHANGGDGIRMGNGTANNVFLVALNGCNFSNNVDSGVYMESSYCSVNNGKFAANTNGIKFSATNTSSSIRGCMIESCSGVSIDNTSESPYVQIIDTDISDGADHGIVMYGKYAQIASCSVMYGSGTSKIGIDCRVPNITIPQETTVISMCKVSDWTSYGIIGNSQVMIDSCEINNIGDAGVFIGDNSRVIGCSVSTTRALCTAAYIIGSGSSISACSAGPGAFPDSENAGNFRYGIALATDFAITAPSSNCICMGNVITGAQEIGILVPSNTATNLSINANKVASTGNVSGTAAIGINLNGTTGMIVNANAVIKTSALTTFDATGIILGADLTNAILTANVVKTVTVVSGAANGISDLGTGTIGLSPQTNDVSLV